MPLSGEYEPSPIDRVREQVELYEATNGVEGGTLNGKPVIVLTCKGAKSGKIRKPYDDINRQGYHDTHDTMANIDLDYGAALAAIVIESVARLASRSPSRSANA